MIKMLYSDNWLNNRNDIVSYYLTVDDIQIKMDRRIEFRYSVYNGDC